MLYSIDTGKFIERLPHKKEYEQWRKRISDEDFAKIIDELEKRVDSTEINTAG